ncbi:hypothetical protein MANY_23600 [Mycolicibacterium anyangense]|uniref:PE-PGRS family protein n=1 Tax=Mycolicibacterium anyangense TaxID=1431246 RepID=A0A6N4W9J0_9MYCO|nr:hypothetical protein [Mycolicibacterium anyangense]BBZ77023.1 hypothetical protein MANY_23600 [Mycolicibacterium anyangense]
MQISLRSHLIAGTAAVVGASAIAMTPVVAQHDLALPAIQAPAASASVQLAGFDSPITELLTSIGLTNQLLFQNVGPVLSPAVPWSGLSKLGLLPQIITDALPVVRQLGLNGSDYIYQSVKGLGTSAVALSEGVWNAAGQLASLNIQGAINTLVTAVQFAGQNALAAGNYVLQGVITRATAVVNNLVPILSALPGAVINQGLVVAGAVVKVVTNAVNALSAPNPIEGVWNAVVDGLLGPTGIPGVLNALTIGPGVDASATPPINAYVPSVRTVVTSVVKAVQTGLATANPAPPPATAVSTAAPSASSLRAAAAESSTTSTVETKKSDEGTSGGSATAGDNKSGGSSAGSDNGSSNGGSKSTGGSARAHKAKSAD